MLAMKLIIRFSADVRIMYEHIASAILSPQLLNLNLEPHVFTLQMPHPILRP